MRHPFRNSVARLLVAALLAGAAVPAHAFVDKLFPIQELVDTSVGIVVAQVETVDPQKRVGTFKVIETLKGKACEEVTVMNLNASLGSHSDPVLRHMVPGTPMLVMWTDDPRYMPATPALLYANRFFFQLWGSGRTPGKAWQLMHFEPRMTRTYNGSVEDLVDSVRDYLAGKGTPPAPDAGRPDLTLQDLMKMPLPVPMKKAGEDRASKDAGKKAEANSAAPDEKSARLKALLGKVLTGGKKPSFRLKVLKADVTVGAIDGNGQMTLTWSGSEVPYPWSKLEKPDLRNLAESLSRLDPEGKELFAYFKEEN